MLQQRPSEEQPSTAAARTVASPAPPHAHHQPLESTTAKSGSSLGRFDRTTIHRAPLLFGNPVFQREVGLRLSGRTRSRLGRVGWGLAVGVGLPLFHLIFLGNALGPGNALNVRSAAVALEALLLPVVAASLASGVFTTEREGQTWNALLLSRLTASQIVIGKLAGALVPALLMLAALWPANLLIGMMAEVPWRNQVVELVCLLATTVFSASIGGFWSWAVRRTQSAHVFTSASVLVLLLGSFIIHALWNEVRPSDDPYFGTIANFVPHWFNPLVVVGELASNRIVLSANPSAIVTFLTFVFVATTLLVAIPIRRLRKGPSEMEH